MNRKIGFALFLMVLAGFFLRIIGLNFGLPSKNLALTTYHVDEAIHLYSLEKMEPAKFNFYPGDALYWGSFHVYLQGFLSKIADVLGVVQLGNREFLKQNLKEVDKLYIIGRLISIIFGTLAIFVFFLIAKKIYGAYGGLLSALLISIMPLPVIVSLYAKPDGVMFFWYLLTLYFSICLMETGQAKYYFLTGLSLGLAAVSKYSGGISLVFLLAAHSAIAYKKRNLFFNFDKIFLAVLLSALTFLVINPYSIIRYADFLRYFTGMVVSKSSLSGNILMGYKEYLTLVLPTAMGWPAYILAIYGIALAIKKPKSMEILALIFTLFYLVRFGVPGDQGITYSLPVLPFLLLFAARSILSFYKNIAGKVIICLVIVYTIAYSFSYKNLFWQRNTRELASEWLENNIAKNSVIGIAQSSSWTPPIIRQYNPPFRILESGSITTPISDAVMLLKNISNQCEYIVITDIEYNVYFKNPKKYFKEIIALEKLMKEDYKEIARFEKHISFFNLPYYPKFTTCDWMTPNPTIHILKNRVYLKLRKFNV